MSSLSFFNYVVRYPLDVIDDFTKYAWVKPFSKKNKKKIKTVLNGFMTNKKTKAVRDSFIGIVHESKQTK